MTRIVRPLAALMLSLVTLSSVAADDFSPRVTFMQSGANELLKDLKYLLSLTNAKEQKQWKVIEEYFEEIFLIGIDRTQPIRIDMILEEKSARYRPSFPVTYSIKQFRESLESFGVDNKKINIPQRNLYKLSGAFEGYMLVKDGYASIGEQRADVPQNLADPRVDIKPLLDRKFDVAFELQNSNEGQDDRRKSFQNLREELLASLAPRQGEKLNRFKLRKMLAVHQMDEGERFYVEAAHVIGGWTTDIDPDVENKEGRLELGLTAIPDTSLAESIALIGETPSYFASIGRSQNPILSGRINFPLDESRKTRLLELSNLLRPIMKDELGEVEDLGEEEKKNAQKAADLFFDMINAGIVTGILDGFVEVHENDSGKNTIVGGIKVPNGNVAIEFLELLPKTREGRQVEMNIDSAGDVKIHKVVINTERFPEFQDFFGDDLSLYVGTEKDAIWYSAGDNAVAELKTAVEKGGTTVEDSQEQPFIDLFAKLGPWVELLNNRLGKKGQAAYRKLAIEAFKLGDDTLTLQMSRDGEQIKGNMHVQLGILRFAGKMIADFSKENLEE